MTGAHAHKDVHSLIDGLDYPHRDASRVIL